MSKNKRRKSQSSAATPAEEPMSSRVVAIPKTQESENVETEPELLPSPLVAQQEPELELRTEPVVVLQEPEPAPRMEPVVVLQEPKQESASKSIVPEPKPVPKAVKQKSKSDRIGDVLRETRLERNDDLYLIAEYLCIKPAFLIALENSRYDEFPADAYVIGFLRTYANFLGVDGKEAVDRYRYEMAGRRKKPVLSMPTPVSEGRAPSGIIMVGATVVLLLIYALWYGVSSSNRTDHTPPPLPTATQAIPTTAATSPNVSAGLTAPVVPSAQTPSLPPVQAAATAPAASQAAPEALTTQTAVAAPVVSTAPAAPPPSAAPAPLTAGTPPANVTPPTAPTVPPASPGIIVTAEKTLAQNATKEVAPEESADKAKTDLKAVKDNKTNGEDNASRVVIRATQNSWIMVVNESGKTIFDRVLKPGDIYKVPNMPGLLLTTGNGNGIVLSLDGTDLQKIAIGAPHVVRNISLDPERLASIPAVSTR